jgi:hypothetical protein
MSTQIKSNPPIKQLKSEELTNIPFFSGNSRKEKTKTITLSSSKVQLKCHGTCAETTLSLSEKDYFI